MCGVLFVIYVLCCTSPRDFATPYPWHSRVTGPSPTCRCVLFSFFFCVTSLRIVITFVELHRIWRRSHVRDLFHVVMSSPCHVLINQNCLDIDLWTLNYQMWIRTRDYICVYVCMYKFINREDSRGWENKKKQSGTLIDETNHRTEERI